MLTHALLDELGMPRSLALRNLLLRLANRAVSRGADESSVCDLIRRLGRTPDPDTVDLRLLAPFAEPADTEALKNHLQAWRRAHPYFAERPAPAPYRVWGEGDKEPQVKTQITNACRLPVAVGAALMPDAHGGYGLPIGGVLAVKNAVIPYAVGVDIACRMRLTVLDLPTSALETDRARLKDAVESQTRFGIGAAFEMGERSHPVMDDPLWHESFVLKGVFEKAQTQLGTSGSGNHFVEFGVLTVSEDVSEPGFTLAAGDYLALLSHSGSRGAGSAVADYFSALAASLHPELPEDLRHLAWLSLDSDEGRDYWAAMELMGRYAAANHELIHRHILEHLGAKALATVENHHNFAWKETLGDEEVVIHRKGATPAGKGVLGVIPGSMATSGFVVRGKGNPDSYSSSSHGAGRLMSRARAFKTLSRDEWQRTMAEKGIEVISATIDESPAVYKDIRSVMAAQADLVDVLAEFKPRLVKMAPDAREEAQKRRARADQKVTARR